MWTLAFRLDRTVSDLVGPMSVYAEKGAESQNRSYLLVQAGKGMVAVVGKESGEQVVRISSCVFWVSNAFSSLARLFSSHGPLRVETPGIKVRIDGTETSWRLGRGRGS